MQKIPTLFDRDWEGNRKVINQLDPRLIDKEIDWSQAICTEKFNGTNVAVTIQDKRVIKYWKRKNPTKEEKKLNIEPSYIEVDFKDSNNKHIIKCFQQFDWEKFFQNFTSSDGLYSAEAIGPNIQGNPYKLTYNWLIFFSIPGIIQYYNYENVIPNFDWLKNNLPYMKSHLSPSIFDTIPIEGLIWHFPDKSMIKIKTVDFEY